jgi:hypothetical protein
MNMQFLKQIRGTPDVLWWHTGVLRDTGVQGLTETMKALVSTASSSLMRIIVFKISHFLDYKLHFF